jgi:hypothetical protein
MDLGEAGMKSIAKLKELAVRAGILK